MRFRKGVRINRLGVDEPVETSWSPIRLILGVGATANIAVGAWLVISATEVDGSWPIGWRLGSAVALGATALLLTAGAVLGMAERH